MTIRRFDAEIRVAPAVLLRCGAMRSGIRAQNLLYLVLGSALLSLAFAACSLNPQPIPPGARASATSDAGAATNVPGQKSSETGDSSPSDAGQTNVDSPVAAVEGGLVDVGADPGDAGDGGDAGDPDDADVDGSADGAMGD